MHWHTNPHPSPAVLDADVIVTHEFGDQRAVSGSTRAIVERAIEASRQTGKPLICQYPGNIVAMEAGIAPVAVISQHLLSPGAYLDTEEVNRQVAAACKENGWTRAILYAHPDHAWRAKRNLSRHGVSAAIGKLDGIRYDASCARFILRSPWTFIPRELLARGLYLAKGWI